MSDTSKTMYDVVSRIGDKTMPSIELEHAPRNGDVLMMYGQIMLSPCLVSHVIWYPWGNKKPTIVVDEMRSDWDYNKKTGTR